MGRDHESVRTEFVERTLQRAGESEHRLFWPAEERQAFANQQLAELLEFASERSPWHQSRLVGVELSDVSVLDMSALPTMNKRDLHEHWDEICTDPALTYDVANRHLERLSTEGFSFALDRYVIFATGGSTGRRSVIAADAEAMGSYMASLLSRARNGRPAGLEVPATPVQVRLAAQSPIHISAAISAVMNQATGIFVTVAPSTPIAEAVTRLNEAQPFSLAGYGSMLHIMALEQLAGRLRIEPMSATNMGEPLMPETAAVCRDAFGIGLRNDYGASECPLGVSWRDSTLLHLCDDTTVIELVDHDNQPVPPGTRSAKLLITNLTNRLQPLIRYEITDEVTEAIIDPDHDDPSFHAPGPWSGRWIHPPLGRNDDWFTYGDVIVHPSVFRSSLASVPEITEYQITQTPTGADIAAVAHHRIDMPSLGEMIVAELRRIGLDDPAVNVQVVNALDRHPDSGKLRRFIPKA